MIDATILEAVLSLLDARFGASVDGLAHDLKWLKGFALSERETLAVLEQLQGDGLAEQRNGEWWRVAVKAVGEVQAELF